LGVFCDFVIQQMIIIYWESVVEWFWWSSWSPGYSLLCMGLKTFWNLFSFCWRSSTQEFPAGPSEFLPDLHFLCKIVLKPSNFILALIPLLLF
jgi:hypothetical protein